MENSADMTAPGSYTRAGSRIFPHRTVMKREMPFRTTEARPEKTSGSTRRERGAPHSTHILFPFHITHITALHELFMESQSAMQGLRRVRRTIGYQIQILS